MNANKSREKLAAMVAAMRKIVNDMEVSNDDIRTEEFSGY